MNYGERIDATCEWLCEELAKIEDRPQWSSKPANVLVNAPLAIIQVELKARHAALTDCLVRLEANRG